MNKRMVLRQKVWLKYNKHCAYCGRLLEYKDMQIDHIFPRHLIAWLDDERARKVHGFATNDFVNLMPSCRRCNHYKREQTLEGFRKLMKTLHERLINQYTIKVAMDYGIAKILPFDGKFYFESVKKDFEEVMNIEPSNSQ